VEGGGRVCAAEGCVCKIEEVIEGEGGDEEEEEEEEEEEREGEVVLKDCFLFFGGLRNRPIENKGGMEEVVGVEEGREGVEREGAERGCEEGEEVWEEEEEEVEDEEVELDEEEEVEVEGRELEEEEEEEEEEGKKGGCLRRVLRGVIGGE
jgi:hypothetical protein